MNCKWCKKEIKRGNFCCPLHRLAHRKFRNGFEMEMYDLKLKPKVSDTEKYKIIRRYLTNTYLNEKESKINKEIHYTQL